MSNASLPVYVFVHGGGLREGAGSFTFYDGAAFAASNNVVVVTLNYRLGPFGFLVTTGHTNPPSSQGSGGMNGFIDILVSLQWVQVRCGSMGMRLWLHGLPSGSDSAWY